MLNDLLNLFKSFKRETAPKTLPTALNPAFYRPSFNQSLDVDFVQSCILTALQGDMTPLLGLYRDVEAADSVIQSAISTRKLAVTANGWNVVKAPNSGTVGARSTALVSAMLDRSSSFKDSCDWLLHGCIWPVSIVERRWVPGGTGFSHPEFRPVPLELYDYRTRVLRIRDTDEKGNLLATSHAPDSTRYIQHRGHMLMAPDHWGGPMRALLFWSLFGTQGREWWARFLERFGSPFLVGTFDKNDDESRMNLERAFQEATRLFGLVTTRETQVAIHEVANSANSGQAFAQFWETAKAEKLLLILGQTLSGQAQSTGLGSGVANLQSSVRQDVRLSDSAKLTATVQRYVVKPFMELNDIPGPAPFVVFGGLDPEMLMATGNALQQIDKAGLEVTDQSVQVLSRRIGLELQRKSPPPAPVMMPTLAAAILPPSTLANESLAAAAAANLSRAWGEELAPLAHIIATSQTRAQVLSRASAFLGSLQLRRSGDIIAEVLEAHAANAIARN